MPQPLGYFGVDRHNSLVAAMQEKWGEGLQHYELTRLPKTTSNRTRAHSL